MEYLREQLLTFLRVLVWYADYAIYSLFNPFKFKKAPSSAENILVIELKYIGDIIVSTPAIHALKEKYPNASIDIIVPEAMNSLLENNPDINSIINWDKNSFSEKLASIKNRYDLAVIFHNGTFEVSLLLLLARISFRAGCTKVGIIEGKGYFLHRNTEPTFELKHKVEDNLDVIKAIGITPREKNLHLYSDKRSDKKIKRLLLRNKITHKDFLVIIHPMPQHKSHEWFKDRFARLADELINKYKAKIVFSGSNKDIECNKDIIRLMKSKALNMAGTSLQDFISLINHARLVISVDTGAMHIAAALNKPVISLFGAGNPKIWKPYCKKSFVIFKEGQAHTSCMEHSCYLKGNRYMECMKSIAIEDVLYRVKDAIK